MPLQMASMTGLRGCFSFVSVDDSFEHIAAETCLQYTVCVVFDVD
jgi:hypothetical protein